MSHEEPWQLFAENGQPLAGEAVSPSDGRKQGVNVGAAHVWIWKRGVEGIEILLQKRAKNKPTWPSHLDISAAGHIDSDETPLEAAVRECSEEISLDLNPLHLCFIFSYRNFDNGTKWIYLYELVEEKKFTFADGEVESLHWVSFTQFESMVSDPTTHGLVPHSQEYFSLLVKAIGRYE